MSKKVNNEQKEIHVGGLSMDIEAEKNMSEENDEQDLSATVIGRHFMSGLHNYGRFEPGCSIEEACKDIMNARKNEKLVKGNDVKKELNRKYGVGTRVLEIARQMNDPDVNQLIETYKLEKVKRNKTLNAIIKAVEDKSKKMVVSGIYGQLGENNKINGGNNDMGIESIVDILNVVGNDIQISVVERPENGLYRSHISGEKVSEIYGGSLDVVYNKSTGEVVYLATKPEGKIIVSDLEEIETTGYLDANSFGDYNVLESKSVNMQDQIDEYEDQEEAIQEKIQQLNDVCDAEADRILAVKCFIGSPDSKCECVSLKDNENCRIVDFNLFNGSLILNIGLDPVGFEIDKDMNSFTDILIRFNDSDIDENDEVVEYVGYRKTIAEILNEGLGCWYSYGKDLYLNPLEYRGLTKLYV